MFSLAAGGTLLGVVGAAPAQAQVFSPGLSTSAANPSIYFSSNGVASNSSFSGYQFQINQITGNLPTIAGASTSAGYQYTSVAAASGNGSACAATDFTAGTSISATPPTNDFYQVGAATGATADSFAVNEGWSYPGQGYIGLENITNGGTFYGWASINLAADDTATLNSFAFQTTAGTAILTGATPAAASAAPEPDAIALLALGASGLAALRLRRKVQAAAA